MMFDTGALAAIAQLGLGLAGFSGIGLLLTRTTGRLQRFELYRLGIMLGTAVGAMFLALVPIVLVQFGWRGETVCRVAAAIMALYSTAFLIYYLVALAYFRRTVPEIIGRVAAPVVLVLHSLNLLAQTATALGWVEQCAGLFMVGLLWLLAHGTYQFYRILFIRPRDPAES